MTEIEFTITEPKSPLLIRILVALFMTTYIGLCYYFTVERYEGTRTVVYLIILGFFVFRYMVVPYITFRTNHLNFKEQKIRSDIEIGRFTIKGKWKNLKDLKYISVFKTDNGYEVNLWYKKRNILNLFALDDYDTVMKEAFFFSEKLNIDLLDARKRGYHRWVDKEVYRTTGNIVYIE